jgi:hypothetical protein
MKRLANTLCEQRAEGSRLDYVTAADLKELGYGR